MRRKIAASADGLSADWNIINLTDSAWTRTAVGNSAVSGQEVISGTPAYNNGAMELTYEFISGVNRRWRGGAAGTGYGDGELFTAPLYEGGVLTGTTRLTMSRNFILQIGITEVTGFTTGGAGIYIGLCSDDLGERVLWGKYSNGHANIGVYSTTTSSGATSSTSYSSGTWPVFGSLQLSADGHAERAVVRAKRGVSAGGTLSTHRALSAYEVVTGDLNLCVGVGATGIYGTVTNNVSFRLGWRILPQGSTYNV